MSAAHTSTSTNSIHCAPCGSSTPQPHQRQPGRHQRQHARPRPPTRRPPAGARARSTPAPRATTARRAPSMTRGAAGALAVRHQAAQQQHRDQHHVGGAAAAAVRSAGMPTTPRRRRAPCSVNDDHRGRSGVSHNEHRQQRHGQHHGGQDPLAQRFGHERALRAVGLAEAPLAAGKECQRRLEVGGLEIRPQARGEVQLGVGQVPQQEIADALLAAGADEQVRLRQPGERQVLRRSASSVMSSGRSAPLAHSRASC